MAGWGKIIATILVGAIGTVLPEASAWIQAHPNVALWVGTAATIFAALAKSPISK
jgi:hypothetical protein